MVKTYSNKTETVDVIMDDTAIGVHIAGKTAVRKTTNGLFAVISSRGSRLIKTFADSDHARRYNFAIHGDSL